MREDKGFFGGKIKFEIPNEHLQGDIKEVGYVNGGLVKFQVPYVQIEIMSI